MIIDINLNFQPNKPRSTKTLRIFSLITLLLAIVTAIILLLDIESSAFILWFYMFYFLVFSISLFIQSKGKHIFDLIGKSYLKMDETVIELKPAMMSKKVLKIQWEDIEELNMKLFEVHLRIKNKWQSINLEKLSDDNLKAVKQVFANYQEKLHVEKNLVA